MSDEGRVCPICGGTEYISYKDESGEIRYEPCRCLIAKQTKERLARSGLDKVMERYTFEKFEAREPWQRNIRETAEEYAEDPDGWFFIGGQSGCGKTHICTAITVRLIERGNPSNYMKWCDDSRTLKSLTMQAEYIPAIERLKEIKVLCIDDLFKGGVTDADKRLAFEIINARYMKDLPTIISSEYRLTELARIDEAIGGRIAEMTKGRAIDIKPSRERNIRISGRSST